MELATWERKFIEAVNDTPALAPDYLITNATLSDVGIDLAKTRSLGGGFSGAYVFSTSLTKTRTDCMYMRLIDKAPTLSDSGYILKVYLDAVDADYKIVNNRPWRETYTLAKMTPTMGRSDRRTGFGSLVDSIVIPWKEAEPLFLTQKDVSGNRLANAIGSKAQKPANVTILLDNVSPFVPDYVLVNVYESAMDSPGGLSLSSLKPSFIASHADTWKRSDLLAIGLQTWATYEMMCKELGGHKYVGHWDLHPDNIFVNPDPAFRTDGDFNLLNAHRTNCNVAMARLQHRYRNYDRSRAAVRAFRNFNSVDNLDNLLQVFQAERSQSSDGSEVNALRDMITDVAPPLQVKNWKRITLIDFDLTTSVAFPDLNSDHKGKIAAVSQREVGGFKIAILTERTIAFLSSWVGAGPAARWMHFLANKVTAEYTTDDGNLDPKVYDHMHLLTYVALGCAIQLSDRYNIDICPLFVWSGQQLLSLIHATTVMREIVNLTSKMMNRFWKSVWNYLTDNARLTFRSVMRQARNAILGENNINMLAAITSSLLPVPINALLKRRIDMEEALGRLSAAYHRQTGDYLSQDVLALTLEIRIRQSIVLPWEVNYTDFLPDSAITPEILRVIFRDWDDDFDDYPTRLSLRFGNRATAIKITSRVESQKWQLGISNVSLQLLGNGRPLLNCFVTDIRIEKAMYDATKLTVSLKLSGFLISTLQVSKTFDFQKVLGTLIRYVLSIVLTDNGMNGPFKLLAAAPAIVLPKANRFSVDQTDKAIFVKLTDFLAKPPDKEIMGMYMPCLPTGISDMGYVNDAFDCVEQINKTKTYFQTASETDVMGPLFESLARSQPTFTISASAIGDVKVSEEVGLLTLYDFIRGSSALTDRYIEMFSDNRQGMLLFKILIADSSVLKSSYISWRVSSTEGGDEVGCTSLRPTAAYPGAPLSALIETQKVHSDDAQFVIVSNAPTGIVEEITQFLKVVEESMLDASAAGTALALYSLPDFVRDAAGLNSVRQATRVQTYYAPGYDVQRSRRIRIQFVINRLRNVALSQDGLAVKHFVNLKSVLQVGKSLLAVIQAAASGQSEAENIARSVVLTFVSKVLDTVGLDLQLPSPEELLDAAGGDVQRTITSIMGSVVVTEFTKAVIQSLTTLAKRYDDNVMGTLPKLGNHGYGMLFSVLSELNSMALTATEERDILREIIGSADDESYEPSTSQWFDMGRIALPSVRAPVAAFSDLVL